MVRLEQACENAVAIRCVLKNFVSLIPNIVNHGAAPYHLAQYYLKKSCRPLGGTTRRFDLFPSSILLRLRVSSL